MIIRDNMWQKIIIGTNNGQSKTNFKALFGKNPLQLRLEY